MEKIISFVKKNELGLSMTGINVLLIAATVIYYACFSGAANVFQIGIFLCYLFALLLCVASFFKIPYVKSYLTILIIFLLTLGLTLLAMNSVGDITEFFTGVGMYGNRNNYYHRVALFSLSFVAILLEIVATFFGIEEKTEK